MGAASMAIALAFAALAIQGALSDLLTFRIPNWVPSGLALLFALQCLLAWQLPPLGKIGFAVIVFAICFAFWRLRLIGGGDVKFLTALALFMGPQAGLGFLVLLAVSGACFAAALKLWVSFFPEKMQSSMPDFLTRLRGKAALNQLPYGFPAGLSAVVMIPRIFSS